MVVLASGSKAERSIHTVGSAKAMPIKIRTVYATTEEIVFFALVFITFSSLLLFSTHNLGINHTEQHTRYQQDYGNGHTKSDLVGAECSLVHQK